MNKDKITVSIITPFYNTEQYIKESFNSVINQQIDKNIYVEYLLVNDCSTDNSLSIINELILTNNNENINIKLLNTPENLGCGGARKFGIDNSTGDYLMFVDADDSYINNDFVNRAVNDIIENNADIVEYGVQYLNLIKSGPYKHYSKEKIVIEDDVERAEILLFKDNFIKFHVWTKIIKQSISVSYPYSIRRTFEDVDTIPIWVANAHKIVIMPSVEINYNKVPNSIITSDSLTTRIGTINSIAELFPIFKDNRNILKAMYIRSLMDFKPVLLNHTSNDPGFNELSKFNTYMLSFLYPNNFTNLTYNIT